MSGKNQLSSYKEPAKENIGKKLLRIAVCDDEPLAMEYIVTHLQQWADFNDCILRILTFSNAEQFLFTYEVDKDLDILFLDIQMGKMNGVELAHRIREKDERIQIVFITALTDYIAEGSELSALHYLVKPVSKDKLYAVMDRAVQNSSKTDSYVLLTVDQTVLRVPVNSIMFAETFAHYIVITTKNGTYQVRENASSLSEKLGDDFIRPHRSYLVNLRYIHSISRTEILLDDKTSIPLSRYNYQKVNQAFIQYYRGALESGI